MSENLQLLDHRITILEENHDELKDVLRELTQAINKLAIIDEKQIQSALIMDRLAGEIREVRASVREQADRTEVSIRRLGERIGPLELAAPQNRQAFGWVQGGVLALAVVTLQFVATKVGLK